MNQMKLNLNMIEMIAVLYRIKALKLGSRKANGVIWASLSPRKKVWQERKREREMLLISETDIL